MTKKFKINKKSFLLAAGLLVFAACLIVANMLASYLLSKTDSKTNKVSAPEFTIYMLSLSKSQVKNEVTAIVPDYQKIGAGGFIWQKDKYYHCISSAYINKNDAEMVKNSIKLNKNIDGEVFSIKFPSFTMNGNFSNEEKKVVLDSLMVAQTFYSAVYDVAISLDTGVYNEISAKLTVNNISHDVTKVYANFNTLFPSEIKNPMSELKAYLKSMTKLGQALASDNRVNKAQDYSSHLKYRYLEALSLYYSFITK